MKFTTLNTTMNNKYFLLRHGQTIYQKEKRNTNYIAEENPFITLTEEGKEMIEKIAETLKSCKIDLIFASPYERTKQTAEITANITGNKEINYDERLIDINLGVFMGKPMKESHQFYLGKSKAFENKPKGGESWGDILKRLKSFLDDIEKQYRDKNILIISHADPIWLMAGYLRGFETEEQFLEARQDRENSYPKLGQLIKI